MHHFVDWDNSLMTGQTCVTKIDDEMGTYFGYIIPLEGCCFNSTCYTFSTSRQHQRLDFIGKHNDPI